MASIGEKVFLFQKQIEMFLADGIAGIAARQQVNFQKVGKFIDRALRLFDGCTENARVDRRGLHFWMIRQAVKKTDAALGAFEGILRPKLGRIGFFAV